MSADSLEAYEALSVAWARREAERIRMEATALAGAYERLAERQELDQDLVEADAAAVIRAWERLRSPNVGRSPKSPSARTFRAREAA